MNVAHLEAFSLRTKWEADLRGVKKKKEGLPEVQIGIVAIGSERWRVVGVAFEVCSKMLLRHREKALAGCLEMRTFVGDGWAAAGGDGWSVVLLRVGNMLMQQDQAGGRSLSSQDSEVRLGVMLPI